MSWTIKRALRVLGFGRPITPEQKARRAWRNQNRNLKRARRFIYPDETLAAQAAGGQTPGARRKQ
jgi:hypothetical protein